MTADVLLTAESNANRRLVVVDRLVSTVVLRLVHGSTNPPSTSWRACLLATSPRLYALFPSTKKLRVAGFTSPHWSSASFQCARIELGSQILIGELNNELKLD